MAAHILRLRATLLVGSLRGDRRVVIRTVAGLIVIAAATIAGCWAILSLADARVDVAQTVLVLGGSALTLACGLAPLMLGLADPLDPRRFAVFGMSERSLTWTLVLAGLLSVPIAALVALAVCAAIVWAAHDVPVVVAVLSAAMGVLTCVLLARLGMGVAALVLRDRRSRELSGLFVLALIVVVVPVGVFLASLEWGGRVPTQLETAATALTATPLGAAWGLPGSLAGQASPLIAAAVAVVTLALLAWAWRALVTRLLTTTERPASGRDHGGLGWFAVAPGTPTGAIAARSLIYWFRDGRYLVNIIVVPIAAALLTVPLLIAGVPAPIVALVPVPVIALFFGWLPHNDVAYDSTALWMHLASGTRGLADRLGRLVPILLIGIPILAILTPVAITLYDRWALLPALAGVVASLFFSGLGLSSISSVVAPYPASRPGDSPFQQPQHSGADGAIAQALVMIGTLVVSAPTLWWAWLALTRDVDHASMALWVGLGTGALVLAVGLGFGSWVFGRRGERLMEFAEAN